MVATLPLGRVESIGEFFGQDEPQRPAPGGQALRTQRERPTMTLHSSGQPLCLECDPGGGIGLFGFRGLEDGFEGEGSLGHALEPNGSRQ